MKEKKFKAWAIDLNTTEVRMNFKIKVTERDLREQVRDLCNLTGWKMYFSWTSIHSPRGFPDLVLANPEKQRVIFAELKSEKGKVTPEQQEWLDVLKQCGAEVFVWHPEDFEEIVRLLA
jgi:hypothetical protein